MTTISAKRILVSQHAQIPNLSVSTLLLRYPRWIHAEARAHRVIKITEDMEIEIPTPSVMEDENLSRNSASSRAIPVSKMIQDVIDDPAIPLFWGKNQPGMQAIEETSELINVSKVLGVSHPFTFTNEAAWLMARDLAVEFAKAFSNSSYHKQIVNRLLEPFSHITVVATATNWTNFDFLRNHKDAEPHADLLAKEIKKALVGPADQILAPGNWHLPFVEQTDWDVIGSRVLLESGADDLDEILNYAKKLSVARCASTSYKTVDGFDMTLDRAIALHDKLVSSEPLHASPAEHVCYADNWLRDRYHNGFNDIGGWENDHLHGNFEGFCQYRKTLPGEYH